MSYRELTLIGTEPLRLQSTASSTAFVAFQPSTAGALALGSTAVITTGAAAGELVLGYQKNLRGHNNASNTVALIRYDESASYARVVIGDGYAGSPVVIAGVANASLPAASTALDGLVMIDTTNNRLVYYSGGARRFMAAGTTF